MNNVTALIISFLRKEYTKKCVKSLRDQYPEIHIVVAENGEYDKKMKKYLDKYDAEYIDMPFDSGVCVARNELVKRAKTKYVLVGDDDFFYTPEAQIEKMKTFLDNTDFDLIGGRVKENGQVRNYQGNIEIHDDHFHYHALDVDKVKDIEPKSGLRYTQCDLTFNYFLARRESVLEWDEQIKVAYEHSAWFIDMKLAGKKIAFSPDPIVVHKPKIKEKYPDYRSYRNRKIDKDRFFERFDIEYTIDMGGRKDMAKEAKQIKHVDFLITTFIRYDCLEALLESIAKYYPNANIYIADQNKKIELTLYKEMWCKLFKAGLKNKPKIFNLPFDCGLSYARNYLVANTPNQYKLILDDDFVFTEETKIEDFVTVMEEDQSLGVVGGALRQNKNIIHFEHHLKREGDTLYHILDDQKLIGDKVKYRITGCVFNFCLIRKEVFNDIKWDGALKLSEHTDFYLRFPHDKWKIAYVPDVIVSHPPNKNPEYRKMRVRNKFLRDMMDKHRLKKIKYVNGQCFILDDGKVLNSREPREKANIMV